MSGSGSHLVAEIIAGLVFLVISYCLFRSLRLINLLVFKPASKINQLSEGYVRLEGKINSLSNETIVAPVSQTKACWYRFNVQELQRRHTDKEEAVLEWTTISVLKKNIPFLTIEDESGACLVTTMDAEISTSETATTYSNSIPTQEEFDNPQVFLEHTKIADTKQEEKKGLLSKLSSAIMSHKYRIIEDRLGCDDKVIVLGNCHKINSTQTDKKNKLPQLLAQVNSLPSLDKTKYQFIISKINTGRPFIISSESKKSMLITSIIMSVIYGVILIAILWLFYIMLRK